MPNTIRLYEGVQYAYKYADWVLTPEECAVDIGTLCVMCCDQRGLDPNTHSFFRDGKCVDHTAPVSTLFSENPLVHLRIAEGTLRVRFVYDTVKPMRLRVDLRPDRTVQNVLEEIRQSMGYVVTPNSLVCKNVEANPAHTLTESNIQLDDVITLVRSSLSVVELSNKSGETTVQVVFYSKRFSVTLPTTSTIETFKEVLVTDFLGPVTPDAGDAMDYMGTVSASELRVVQLNVIFGNTATLADLKPVAVEVLRQWGPEHLESSHFLNGKLRFNCPFCATAGATAQLRPMCATCRSENVERGTLKGWSDLVGSTASCNKCNTNRWIYWGFFCQGKCCDSRCSTHRNRDMIAIYDSSQDSEALLKAANSCFSYASVAGRVDASAVDHYVAVPVPAEVATSLPSTIDLSGAADWSSILRSATTAGEGGDGGNGGDGGDGGGSKDGAEEDPNAPPVPVPTGDANDANAKAPRDFPAGVVTGLAQVPQQTMLAQGLKLPDTFFTKDATTGDVTHWVGMPQGYVLAECDSDLVKKTVGVDNALAIPVYLENGPRYCLVCIGGEEEDGGTGGVWAALKRLAKTDFKVGPFRWSLLSGFVSADNARQIGQGVQLAKNRVNVAIQPLKPLTKNAYHQLVGHYLAMENLGDEGAVEEFTRGFTAVDDLYRAHTDVEANPEAAEAATAP